jgi:hypothetical protein
MSDAFPCKCRGPSNCTEFGGAPYHKERGRYCQLRQTEKPMNSIVPYKEPARLTEREARLAGQTSNRLCGLRGFLAQGVNSGSLTIQTKNGAQSLTLSSVDTEALIGLLKERDEAFLIGLNIEIEP